MSCAWFLCYDCGAGRGWQPGDEARDGVCPICGGRLALEYDEYPEPMGCEEDAEYDAD